MTVPQKFLANSAPIASSVDEGAQGGRSKRRFYHIVISAFDDGQTCPSPYFKTDEKTEFVSVGRMNFVRLE